SILPLLSLRGEADQLPWGGLTCSSSGRAGIGDTVTDRPLRARFLPRSPFCPLPREGGSAFPPEGGRVAAAGRLEAVSVQPGEDVALEVVQGREVPDVIPRAEGPAGFGFYRARAHVPGHQGHGVGHVVRDRRREFPDQGVLDLGHASVPPV